MLSNASSSSSSKDVTVSVESSLSTSRTDSSTSSTNSMKIPTSTEASNHTDSNDIQAPLSIAKQLISLFCVQPKQTPESVQSLPIFLYPKINTFDFLCHFQCLIKLEIVFCKLSNVTGFLNHSNVTQSLQILNLSNNKIKDLNGIQKMVNLTELHIGENEIISLDFVSNLTQLNVIDFHDNFVQDLKPLSHCKQLRIIRAGNNRIHTIQNYFAELNELQMVNLSANYLLQFTEIDILSTIPKLKHVQFNDPHFGSNPICDLSNYHIYSLYKLNQIESLDGIRIDDSSKKKAQISMYKKNMFYQIVHNCQKRDETALYRILYQSTLKLYRLLLKNIRFAYKYKKLFNCDQSISEYNTICEEIWQDLQSVKLQSEKDTKNKFEIVKYELKTAGNVRLKTCKNEIIDALIKCKITNAEHIKKLNVMKIEHRFADYEFDKYSKDDKPKRKNKSQNTCTNNSIDMDKIFVIDEFFSTDSTDILLWILKWNDLPHTPINIKSHTTILNKPQHKTLVLFVKAFFSKNSKLAIEQNQKEFLIKSLHQLQPLYILELTHTGGDDCCNDNTSLQIPRNELTKSIDGIFSQEIDNISQNMSIFFNHLYSNFANKWTQKLQMYWQSNCDLESTLASFEKETEIITNTPHKIEIINSDIETVERVLLQNNAKEKQLLECINISFNKNMHKLNSEILCNNDRFRNIKCLNLSFNGLKCIPDIFENMKGLQSIDLSGNEIRLLNQLTYLKYCLFLKELNLCNNPIIYRKGFTHLCINIVPSIKILNNKQTKSFQSQSQSPTNNEHFIHLFHQNSYKYSLKSVFDTYDTTNLNVSLSLDKIIHLNLSNCKLLFIPAIISELSNMETLDISNNYILQIKNLSPNNAQLKELSITNNNLRSINGLELFGNNLQKLDIACNDIMHLQSLSSFCPNLKFISFECNKISEIQELSKLSEIIQINAGYNLIHTSFDIYKLSNLSKLAILDLIGNKICDMSHYRQYTIFCCRNSLRMLDGHSITNNEIEQSSLIYEGKLHFDFLIHKIGQNKHAHLSKIESLDLSHSNITILSQTDNCPLNPQIFANLHKLTLSDNSICDITQLLHLKTLTHLDLSRNSIQKSIALYKLQNLQKLDLSHNNIEEIQSLNIVGLVNLTHLSLGNNKLTHINGLINLPSLQILNLSFNKIRKLSFDCFVEIGQTLAELNLSHNGLRSLEYLNILCNLKTLNISENRINKFRQLSLIVSHLQHLITIYIANNPITSTPKSSQLCIEEIIKYSNSLQFVDEKDLNELRTEYKLRVLNAQIENKHRNNLYKRNEYPYSESVSSSSSLLALQNPIGLKIQQFPISKYIKK